MDETMVENQAGDTEPNMPDMEVQGDVALAKFYDVAELTGHDHAELIEHAGKVAKHFEVGCAFSAADVLEACASRWRNKPKF